MKTLNRIFLGIVLLTAMNSCEDVVNVDLEDGTSQLVVDAFLTDIQEPEISIHMSQNYFDNSALNTVEDATVRITSGEETYNFSFEDGKYVYPEVISFTEGSEYKLTVEANDNIYEAISIAQPVPPVDSIVYEFEEPGFGFPSGYLAEFWALDIPGRTDYYWIRHYRNGELFNDPTSIIWSQDAAFSGEGADGLFFIPPIRQGINEFDSLYQSGENLRVELWSINEEIWEFLGEVVEQSTNEGITATPTYNLRSNLQVISGEDELGAIGNFSVSKVSSREVIFE